MKKISIMLWLIALVFVIHIPRVSAEETGDIYSEEEVNELTRQIYVESGSDKLIYSVPDDTKELLREWGFTGFMPGGTDGITAGGSASMIGKIIRDSVSEPLRVLSCILGIVIISAALNAVKSGGSVDNALILVSSLCAVSVTAPPILSLTSELASVITVSGNFMLAYIPVISGLMIASGRTASGTMYSGSMIFLSSAVMQITSLLVLPLLKCIMSLSVVSSSCDGVRLDGIIELFRKASRFILTFCMSLFAAFLTMKSIVSAAADSIANRAVKFAVSSFVPLVGGALSDAYQTVISCVSLLKSGVGAAAIAAVFAIFIPVAVRCAVWQAVTALGSALCGIFGVGRVSSLLNGLSSVVSVMFAVLMCTMVIYIISTAIILIAGG